MIKFLSFTAAMVTAFGLFSCKKGEDDPTLSLKSRKARISGVWKVSSILNSYSYTDGTSSSDSFDGTTWTFSDGTIKSASFTFSFEKDGSMSIDQTIDGDQYVSKGSWAFMGKNKNEDLKKKEAIIIGFEEFSGNGFNTSNSSFFPNNSEIWPLKRLAKDEIVVYMQYNYDGERSETTITLTK